MDIWGHCGTCDRWFYCPASDADTGGETAWSCPVCGAEPVAVENRAVS